jgi:very-short-patch-repair endonuclease
MQYTPDLLRSLGIDPSGLKFHGSTIPYDPTLILRARELRTHGVKAEAYMWKMLKNSASGYKFTRQKPILHYIADFYCHELQLVVEIDGSSHNDSEQYRYDRQRDRDMNALGIKVVRLWDQDVLKNPLAAAGRIFLEAGVEIPAPFSGLHDGRERLWNTIT